MLGVGPRASPRYVLPFRREWEKRVEDEETSVLEQERTDGNEMEEARKLLKGTN